VRRIVGGVCTAQPSSFACATSRCRFAQRARRLAQYPGDGANARLADLRPTPVAVSSLELWPTSLAARPWSLPTVGRCVALERPRDAGACSASSWKGPSSTVRFRASLLLDSAPSFSGCRNIVGHLNGCPSVWEGGLGRRTRGVAQPRRRGCARARARGIGRSTPARRPGARPCDPRPAHSDTPSHGRRSPSGRRSRASCTSRAPLPSRQRQRRASCPRQWKGGHGRPVGLGRPASGRVGHFKRRPHRRMLGPRVGTDETPRPRHGVNHAGANRPRASRRRFDRLAACSRHCPLHVSHSPQHNSMVDSMSGGIEATSAARNRLRG
jgi:hypothetical protein